MKVLSLVIVDFLCLAHSRNCDQMEQDRKEREKERENRLPHSIFIGGGKLQDSCRGEVEFSSKLDSELGRTVGQYKPHHPDIEYTVELADGTALKFGHKHSGDIWEYWATQEFMEDVRALHGVDIDDTFEHRYLGEDGNEYEWEIECVETKYLSDCYLTLGYEPNRNIAVTGKGTKANPDYYEITVEIVKDGCQIKFTDRLVWMKPNYRP